MHGKGRPRGAALFSWHVLRARRRTPRRYAKRATSACSTSTIFSSERTGMNSFTPWKQ